MFPKILDSSHSVGRNLNSEHANQVFYFGASVVAIVRNISPAGVLLARWVYLYLWSSWTRELLLIATKCMLQKVGHVHVEWSVRFGSYWSGVYNVLPLCAKQP